MHYDIYSKKKWIFFCVENYLSKFFTPYKHGLHPNTNKKKCKRKHWSTDKNILYSTLIKTYAENRRFLTDRIVNWSLQCTDTNSLGSINRKILKVYNVSAYHLCMQSKVYFYFGIPSQSNTIIFVSSLFQNKYYYLLYFIHIQLYIYIHQLQLTRKAPVYKKILCIYNKIHVNFSFLLFFVSFLKDFQNFIIKFGR